MSTGLGIARTAAELDGLLAELASIGEDRGSTDLSRRATELAAKLQEQRFVVAVVGEFKRGKSTFINALLGAEVLPAGPIPVTSAVTVIAHGPVPRVEVTFGNGSTQVAAPDTLASFVTERENPGNQRDVTRVVMHHPASLLGEGIALVDTPGVGSIHQQNTDTTRQFLAEVDAAVFVTSADQPVSQAERAFLAEVREHAVGMFFVLNKIDVLQPGDVAEVIDFTTAALGEAIGQPVTLYPMSALGALRARQIGPVDRVDGVDVPDESGLSRFERDFAEFLTEEKANVLARSVARDAERLVTEETNAATVEARTMQLPADEAARVLDQLEDVASSASASRRNLEALLTMETGQLMRTIEADLTALRSAETDRLLTEAHRRLDEHPDPRAAADDIDGAIKESLRHSIEVWRMREDVKLAELFRAAISRFSSETAALTERTTRLCSRLFDVDLSPPPHTDVLDIDSEFTFHFFDPPDDIQMTIEAIRRRTPRSIASRMLRRRFDEDIPLLVDKHCGRLRWDYAQRLDKVRTRLTGELADRLESTLASLRRGVEQAHHRRAAAASDLSTVTAELDETLRRLEAVATGLERAVAR